MMFLKISQKKPTYARVSFLVWSLQLYQQLFFPVNFTKFLRTPLL